MKKRVMLFVHDGSGLGHLRRMCRIAESIQGPCAALIVTGLKEAIWMAPDVCEVLRLPNWASVVRGRAKYWNRPLWLDSIEIATNLREGLLEAAIQSFEPDAILVDYLPFGQREELRKCLPKASALKYLILRGIVDSSDSEILCGEASQVFGRVYDRIIVAADSKMIDVSSQCSFDDETSKKVTYAGYVAPRPVDREAVRNLRGISNGKPWVVCSAGGGMRAEHFLQHCVEMCKSFPDAEFDVILGPLANQSLFQVESIPGNCRVSTLRTDLPELHSSCDIVISSGGYNSVLEAATGGARIIVHPNQVGFDDEQVTNAKKLADFYPVLLISEKAELQAALEKSLQMQKSLERPHLDLNLKGARTIREILLSDLN